MGKWILVAMLLSGCAVSIPGNLRGSDDRPFAGGGAAIATAAAVVVWGTPETPRPYCSDQDPGQPHTCPETTPKGP